MVQIAKLIESVPMTLKDRYVFMTSPVNLNLKPASSVLQRFAQAHSDQTPICVSQVVEIDESVLLKGVTSNAELFDYELKHNAIVLYLWLNVRFPSTFSKRERALELKKDVEAIIDLSLRQMSYRTKFEVEEEDSDL